MDNTNVRPARRRLRHRSRVTQMPIYLGKLLRSFIYQNDWKLLPMSALIAALVSMVVRHDFFLTMEGTMKGSFALTCVAIWNGCFNSIQSICRERDIVKREHRSGMHITSYISAHMIYQALLCLAQTGISMYVCRSMGVRFPSGGFMTRWVIVDIGITVFLISYASDMLSLFVSSISRTTTAAMTVMPFLLIFQLVFSGGIFSLPAWTGGLTHFTLSNYGLKCIAAQADYNALPMVTGWNTIDRMRNEEIHLNVTEGQIMDFLADEDNPLLEPYRNLVLAEGITMGDAIKLLAEDEDLAQYRDQNIAWDFTIGQLLETFGEENIKEIVQQKTAQAAYKKAYEHTPENVWYCWIRIMLLGAACAVLTVIALEFIDKDKR